MSEINYQALRERYSPKPAPECPVCGEKMSVQRVSYGAQGISVVYACSGEGDDGYVKINRTFADEHYAKSRITVRDASNKAKSLCCCTGSILCIMQINKKHHRWYKSAVLHNTALSGLCEI
ncbi:TPA: ead/Ea22-like family protein [Escherichia coli]|nr:ead/Ea22-like family protein [Escherichia coli]